MASTMAWGESLEVLMELGQPVNQFILNDATYGQLNSIARLGGELIADDVAGYCTDITVSRGKTDQLQQFNAGTANITLLNTDRRFDPINESSPYWNPITNRSGVAPRRKITIKSNGVTLFAGRITDVDVSYSPTNTSTGREQSVVEISAADDFYSLANTYVQDATNPIEELTGARVTKILDLPEVAYDATTRDIDTGTATLGGGATFQIGDNANVLSYLQQVAQSEQGFFFCAANGYVTFVDRAAGVFSPPQLSFSDDGTGIPYTALGVVYGQEYLYNRVICLTAGGTDQIAENLSSQTEFGVSTLSLSDLLLKDNAASLALATDLLSQYEYPQYRFDRLETIYNGKSTANQTALSNLDLTEVVNIKRTFANGTPSSVSKLYRIQSVQHRITPNDHRIQLGLNFAETANPFLLNDVVYGKMDADNALV